MLAAGSSNDLLLKTKQKNKKQKDGLVAALHRSCYRPTVIKIEKKNKKKK